jgi:hypothetical protein
MPYTPGRQTAPLTSDTVEMLARLVGLSVPPEDVGSLAMALANQLAALDLLRQLDLTEVDAAPIFDPRWHD